MPEIIYKVALLGPTRSGKTSLISSALAEGQDFLIGTPARFKATGSTLKRIQENKQELDGALAAGSFNPGALAGSQDLTIYDLSLSVGKSILPIHILDYPGGWLTDVTPEFEEVENWIKECNILILPVDAVVAMECRGLEQTVAAYHRLNTAAIESAVQDWANTRVQQKSPGIILLVPVKCESYFSDHGGRRDQSKELHKRVVIEIYKDVIEKVRRENQGNQLLSVFYMPVDTMGCVDLVTADWEYAPDKRLECHARYRIRGAGQRSVHGAGDILVAIAKMIAHAEKSVERNFLVELWRWITDEDKALLAAIKALNDRPWGARVTKVL